MLKKILPRSAFAAWLALLSAGILSNPSTSYPGRDSGIFLYIGALILKGKIPYRDVWENKGPLIFYLNALALWLGGGSRWGVWMLELIFLLAAGVLAYVILKQTANSFAALAGTFIFITAAGNALQGGNFSEEYALLFSFIALFLFLKSEEAPRKKIHPLLIGVTLGLNILLRPNNISVQAAIAGAYFIEALFSKEYKLLFARAARMTAGALLALAPAGLYFWSHNALAEMWNVVIVFNAQYSAGGGAARAMEGVLGAAQAIGFYWIGFAAVGYVLAARILFQEETRLALRGKFFLVLWLGLPLEAALSALSGKNYPHYFIGWALYVGLWSGFAIQILLARWKDAQHFLYTLAAALALISISVHFSVWRSYFNSPHDEYQDAVAEYVAAHTAPQETALIWGFRPIINFVAERESPAAYLPYPLAHVDTPLARRWAAEFYAQLTARPPALIVNMIEPADRERIPDLNPEIRKTQKIKWKEVVLAYNYQETLAFIAEHYAYETSVNGYDVYRLRR
ncbi:MAG: hypothetical protein Fur002_26190 [Anaerolineales bacterium]